MSHSIQNVEQALNTTIHKGLSNNWKVINILIANWVESFEFTVQTGRKWSAQLKENKKCLAFINIKIGLYIGLYYASLPVGPKGERANIEKV